VVFSSAEKPSILSLDQGGRMMAWTAGALNRLYELHKDYIERLRSDVIEANRSLGSHPEKTALHCLSRSEFVAILERPANKPEIRSKWLRRIVRGHEHEFPELTVAFSEPANSTLCFEPRGSMRKTGT
jgi:hypothetical protein